MAYNFHKYGTNRVDSRGVSYDYDSVMHYSSTAFANRRGVRTIVGKNGRTNLGQRYGLSRLDVEQAKMLYCGQRPKPQTPPPPGKFTKQTAMLLILLVSQVMCYQVFTDWFESFFRQVSFCLPSINRKVWNQSFKWVTEFTSR